MITRSLRLRDPREFQRVRKRGRSWTTPYLVLVLKPNGLEHNRYGFAVGRRIGNAVARNKVKRWMREAARNHHPDLKQGFDIVVIARGRMTEAGVDYGTVEQSLGILAERAGLTSPGADSAEPVEQPD